MLKWRMVHDTKTTQEIDLTAGFLPASEEPATDDPSQKLHTRIMESTLTRFLADAFEEFITESLIDAEEILRNDSGLQPWLTNERCLMIIFNTMVSWQQRRPSLPPIIIGNDSSN